MAEIRRVVLRPADKTDRLPRWASSGASVVEWMQQHDRWQEVADRLRVQREGGYAGIDVFLLLVFFFTANLRGGIKQFGEESRPYQRQLAALGSRRNLPSPPSISRFLRMVQKDDLREFGPWLLLQGTNAAHVLQDPSVLTRDATGEGWHVFDWDPTVTVLRHRALPIVKDTPNGRRRSEETAQLGYPGRKRGDVQFSRATLQHAGSGLWVGIRTAPGNGEYRRDIDAAIEHVNAACAYADIAPGRTILRADGAAGNVPFVTACEQAGIGYITRLARYQILEDPTIVEHLNQANWYEVPSSGSGPTRQATDLGKVILKPAAKTLREDGTPFAPVEVRVVVSRFASETGRGAGVTIGKWRYELYATNLSSPAWPEVEIVSGYYGRCGQENRFLQEDRALGLDRIFSYNLPGQEMVNLVGLFIWNFAICRGMELKQPDPADLADQAPCCRKSVEGPSIDVHSKNGSDNGEPPESEAGDTSSANKVEDSLRKGSQPAEKKTSRTKDSGKAREPVKQEGPADHPKDALSSMKKAKRIRWEPGQTLQSDMHAALSALDWPKMLSEKKGWSWDGLVSGLVCPDQQHIPFHKTELLHGHITRLRFVAPPATCDSCELRGGCIRSSYSTYRKDIRISVPEHQAALFKPSLSSGPTSHETKRRPKRPQNLAVPNKPYSRHKPLQWRPPEATSEPKYEVLPGLLLPAKLRQLTRKTTGEIDVHVEISLAAPPRAHSFALATSVADRQKRRLTWMSRLAWNALPDDTAVSVKFAGGNEMIRVLLAEHGGTTDG